MVVLIVGKEILTVASCFPLRNGKYIAFIVRPCFLNIEWIVFYILSCHRIFESEVGEDGFSRLTFIIQAGIHSSSPLIEARTTSASKAHRDNDLTVSQDHAILKSLDS